MVSTSAWLEAKAQYQCITAQRMFESLIITVIHNDALFVAQDGRVLPQCLFGSDADMVKSSSIEGIVSWYSEPSLCLDGSTQKHIKIVLLNFTRKRVFTEIRALYLIRKTVISYIVSITLFI